MFAERDKHYPSSSGQTGLATAVTNFTKLVTNNFGPSTSVETCFGFEESVTTFQVILWP